jgi:outer membrane protein TolC
MISGYTRSSQPRWQHFRTAVRLAVLLVVPATGGCRSAAWHRDKADRTADANLAAAQNAAFGREEPLVLVTAGEQLRRRLLCEQQLPTRLESTGTQTGVVVPDPGPALPDPIVLTPETALQIAARNSRDFQAAKETLFKAALELDLEQAAFRRTFSAILSGTYESDSAGDKTIRSTRVATAPEVTRKFRNGVEMSGSIAVDLVKLLTQGTASSLGLLADAGISVPLLRGAGRDIVAEPLKQAERNLLYAVYSFERFKRAFAVRVVGDYISVLQSAEQIRNAEQNYKSLVTASRRARRLADAGRLPEYQVDQAVQNELRSRTRWIEARESLISKTDRYKGALGLPPDTRIELDASTLRLLHEGIRAASAETSIPETVPPADAPVELALPDEYPEDTLGLGYEQALAIALDSRLDLRTARFQVEDARRRLHVAEDNLRAELTLFGSVQTGERRNSSSSASQDDARLGVDRLRSRALLSLDLPLNRTAERIAYRRGIIALEVQERVAQEVEDQVKLDIRNAFRALRLARENLRIQGKAVRLAERRVRSTDMLLQAGRAVIRDVLEAQEALIGAQNALTAAAVGHRIAELGFQRDLDTLDVSADGILKEINPVAAAVAPPGP